MERLGLRTVKISTLILPNDFPSRIKSDEVKALAKTVKDRMLIHRPTVRASDMTVACGVDRIAAHRYLKIESLEVEMIECTDLELSALRDVENFHRRRYSAAQVKSAIDRMIDIEKAIAKEEKEAAKKTPEAKPEKSKAGRPKGDAAKVAEKMGITKRAVNQKIASTKRRPAVQQKPRPPIDTLGIEMTSKRLEGIQEVVEVFEDIDRYLRDARTRLAGLKKSKLPMDTVAINGLDELLIASQHGFTRQAPKTICLWCKERADLVDDCSACGGAGYTTAEVFDDADSDLRSASNVSVGGKIRSYRVDGASGNANDDDWLT